ncbi:DUF6301 family protein [Buchananella felis]|uniref:DUF6301 family protein n=1 Tax=Buchananella felis TaxID=3231492 RepID=UPI003526E342
MGEFEAMSLERCVATVRAWTEAPWPLTTEQGRAICSKLGWVEDLEKPTFFYVGLGDRSKRDAYFLVHDGGVWSAVFQLTTRVSPEDEQSHGQTVLELSYSLIGELTRLYGTPFVEGSPLEIERVQWDLANGVAIHYAPNTTVLVVFIDSPARTALLDDPRADPNPDERL